MLVNSLTPSGNITKTELAKKLGIARSLLYYHHKRPALDLEIKAQIGASGPSMLPMATNVWLQN